MENKDVVLKKIPLRILLDILTDAWDSGADFIDLIGAPDKFQDTIAIAIKEEYYSKQDSVENEEYDVEVELDSPKNFEDVDLNDLI